MRQRILVVGILSAACVLAGCRKKDTMASDAGPGGSNPNAAAAPAPAPPVAAAPAPEPPAPAAPPTYTLPVGTHLQVRLSQELSSGKSDTGQAFTGKLATSVKQKGVVVIPAGLRVTGTVVDAKSQGKFKGEGRLALSARAVDDEG